MVRRKRNCRAHSCSQPPYRDGLCVPHWYGAEGKRPPGSGAEDRVAWWAR